MDKNATKSLVVDFPSRQRNNRTVTFKSTCDVIVIQGDKRVSKAYSEEENTGFKLLLLIEARRLREHLTSMSTRSISRDQIYHCIGLERYLPRGMLARSHVAKRAHIDAVLTSQDKCDEETLASISQDSSQWARERAGKIAGGYFRLEE
mmetsp:Transcript_8060/g.14122  ORF Transcript_8060/g.14122 Transcript_8060/m.14122 type:complete len:149 (+) Transcript_8060:59-505(+)|eukprot:CAMPEP_0183774264 /NCGR_PEP_ID=MMETSP0739-20130205/41457_1 /TAXON_ID=385413 /ORGANISM="Thalassiosira miniscula, Strain CCMP1093" /LENGTH=148 /DNA_ID=CAMNT_0026015531 /DNA_START=29 /DNA_END=475 /DNA_ORIENTATION=-